MDRSKINFETLALSVVEEINKLRNNPSSYVDKLESQLKYLTDKILAIPGEIEIETSEGKEAYKDAKKFLLDQIPLPSFVLSQELTNACEDHVEDIGSLGLTTHESSDGKNASDRVEKYCEWSGAISQNLDFGSKTAESIVISMILDDGLPERPQRDNLFSNEFKYIGVASGEHKVYEICTVINFVSTIVMMEEKADDQDMTKKLVEKAKNKFNKLLHKNKEEVKESNSKNPFQEEDPDAPDNTIAVKVVKTTKIINGKPKKVTKKIFTLEDNTHHIIETIDN